MFATEARQYSVDPSRDRGGYMGEVPLTALPPNLKSIITGMTKGQISDPVQVNNQWFIIKLDDQHPAVAADYTKLKDKVRQAYMQQKATPLNEIVEKLRQQAKVTILDPKYQAVGKMFGPAPSLPSFGAQKGGGGAQPAQGAQPAPGGQPAPSGQPAPAAPSAAPAAPAAPAPAAPAS
jgi:hypothetical protein